MGARLFAAALVVGLLGAFGGGYWWAQESLREEEPPVSAAAAAAPVKASRPQEARGSSLQSAASDAESEAVKAPTPHLRTSHKKAPAAPLDPNRADAQAFATLPGIGPAIAARIVEDRRQNGPYHRAEDLLRVSGIGPKKLAALKPFLVFPAP